MRDDYKLVGATKKIDLSVEVLIADRLKEMARFTGLSESEICNTALKRFIIVHRDFFPSHSDLNKIENRNYSDLINVDDAGD